MPFRSWSGDEKINPFYSTIWPDADGVSMPQRKQRYTSSGLFRLTFSKTVASASGGIIIMVVGMVIVRAFFLPRIYVCPKGAVCPHSLDPSSDVLQYLQALMVYCLQLGIIISTIGIFKLVSFQSWVVLKREGNRLEVLENNLSALQGNLLSAAKLLLQKNHRSLAAFVISPIVIASSIPLLVSQSISRGDVAGRSRLDFHYATNITLPRYTQLGTIDLQALALLNQWMFTDDLSRRLPDKFQGTITARDDRVTAAVEAQPSGLRVNGSVSCGREGILSVVVEDIHIQDKNRIFHNVTYFNNHYPPTNETILTDGYIRLGAYPLGAPQLSDDDKNVTFSYLWASNTTGWIPNAFTTSDGVQNIAICNHTISMENVSEADAPFNAQFVNPSVVVPADGDSILNLEQCVKNPALCPPRSVYELLVFWWHGAFTDSTFSSLEMTVISCSNGTLTPYPDDGESCQLNNEKWLSTVTGLFDAMVETGPRSGDSSQSLSVRTSSINRTRWWIQGIVPLSTFVLYVVCLGYTVRRARGEENIQQLNQVEFANALKNSFGTIDSGEDLNPNSFVGGK